MKRKYPVVQEILTDQSVIFLKKLKALRICIMPDIPASYTV